jgi:hypothetical protein
MVLLDSLFLSYSKNNLYDSDNLRSVHGSDGIATSQDDIIEIAIFYCTAEIPTRRQPRDGGSSGWRVQEAISQVLTRGDIHLLLL